MLFIWGCINEREVGTAKFKQIFIVKQINYKVLHFNECLQDPSFKTPFNLYFKIKMSSDDFQKFINSNQLKKKDEVDLSKLESQSIMDMAKSFFSMNSVNSVRNDVFAENEKNMNWWQPFDSGNDVYAYLLLFDYMNIKLVDFVSKRNGRIACIFIENSVYILVECWG